MNSISITCSHIMPLYLYRLYLAALDYNENCQREQATTQAGEKRFTIKYPKYKKGGHIVRTLLVDNTYGMCL